MSKTERIESIKQDDTSRERPFGLRDKIGYMFGDFGNDFSFIFASTYLMVFYTKVLGISGFVVGILFMAARVVDAFTDVTMGRIVDRMNSAEDGRFRPWIRRMCIPVAVASTLMYLYFVGDWPYMWKVVYIVVTYLFWGSFCYTAINIPYGSMASVISSDPGDRASLSTFRSVGASLASLVIGTLVPLIVYETDAMGNQIVKPKLFTWIAVVFGVCAVICYLLCYKLCTERVHFDKKAIPGGAVKDGNPEGIENADKTEDVDRTEGTEKESFGEIARGLLGNRPLLSIVCAALVLLLASMLGQTMNNYLFLDYFKNAKAMATLNFVSIGGMLLLAPFIRKISTRFGKKEAGSMGMLLAGVIYMNLYFLHIKSIPVFLVLIFIATLGVGVFNMIIWAYITDIIDYQEVSTGRREDGTVYAVYSFARKVGQALAGGVGGFTLTAIGYVSEATVQTSLVSNRIYVVATLVPGICYLIVFLIMQFWYPLDKHAVEKNTLFLQQKHNAMKE